jgi:hypothetical protein
MENRSGSNISKSVWIQILRLKNAAFYRMYVRYAKAVWILIQQSKYYYGSTRIRFRDLDPDLPGPKRLHIRLDPDPIAQPG